MTCCAAILETSNGNNNKAMDIMLEAAHGLETWNEMPLIKAAMRQTICACTCGCNAGAYDTQKFLRLDVLTQVPNAVNMKPPILNEITL